jgi:hypothetical protein
MVVGISYVLGEMFGDKIEITVGLWISVALCRLVALIWLILDWLFERATRQV